MILLPITSERTNWLRLRCSISRGRRLPFTRGACVGNSSLLPTYLHTNTAQHLRKKVWITAPLCPLDSRARSLLNNYSPPGCLLLGAPMTVCFTDTDLHVCFISSFCGDRKGSRANCSFPSHSNSPVLNNWCDGNLHKKISHERARSRVESNISAAVMAPSSKI